MLTNPSMTTRRKARSTARLVGEEGYSDPLGFGGRFVSTTEREAGSGSIDRVTIDGQLYWRARLWVENAKGVRERKAVCAKTEAGVLKKLALLKKAPAGDTDAKRLTLQQYLEGEFLPGIKQRVKMNTYATYERAVRNHIVPRIGKAKFVGFSARNATAWTAELAADGIGSRATQQAYMVLKRAYGFAVELERIGRNPLYELKAPKDKKKSKRIIDRDEVGALLRAAQGTEAYTLILLAVYSSMRQGELFGLQWKHVNLPEGYLRVEQALLVGAYGEPYLDEPKTDASKRKVTLTPMMVAHLTAHKGAQTDNPHGLVFPAARGGFIRKDNWRRDTWLPLVKLAGLEGVMFHSLRHAGNSLLVSGGVSLKVAQGRLGHATSAVTFDTYTHLQPGETDAAALKMDAILEASGGLVEGARWVSSGVSKLKSTRRKRVGTKKKTLTV